MKSIRQRAALPQSGQAPAPGRAALSAFAAALASSLPFPVSPHSHDAASFRPGEPQSPDELLPKGDAEKPEEELEEEDDEEVLSAAGQRGAGRCGQGVGCGIRVLRNLDEAAPRGARRGPAEVSPEA